MKSGLDYCNTLYSGVSVIACMTAAGPKRLQLGCYVAHASETTYPPHRLPYTGRPVRFRIDFEILLFVFVCLLFFLRHCMGWHLLTSLLTLHTPTTSLRSAERTLPAVLRSRSFTVAAPKLRSKLAFNRTSTNLHTFKTCFKIFFF